MTEDKNKKASKDCLCLYGLDDITIDDLIKHKTTRKELIEIQIRKNTIELIQKIIRIHLKKKEGKKWWIDWKWKIIHEDC